MTYDFDRVVDRKNTSSVKWNGPEGELPMWVADMDFPAAPPILEALEKRIAHGVFGYSEIPEAWAEAYVHWWEERHGFRMEKDSLVFTTGVIPAISSTVRKLTTPNEKVIIQTPVYNIFFNSILNNGCRILENPLLYENGTYRMDLADLEEKMADPQANLMILCNPHNPVGKIWDRETLRAVGEMAERHRVTVLSDEIHCDLTLPDREYVPFLSVSETNRKVCMACLAPTKAFNIAGLCSAAVCVPDPFLRHRITRALNTDEVAEPNAFACDAAVAAFERGGPWLDELRTYLAENRALCRARLEERLPMLRLIEAEATYLLWIDLSGLTSDGDGFAAFLREKTGLRVTPGSVYGRAGQNFLRMNIACPRTLLEDGLSRLEKGTRLYGSL